jgi:hypothetical protein
MKLVTSLWSQFIMCKNVSYLWGTSKFGAAPFHITSMSSYCNQGCQDNKTSRITTEQTNWFKHKYVLSWQNHEIPTHNSWTRYTVYVTRLPVSWGDRSTTSVERRLRRNSGSRPVAHCFYPLCVRTTVGVSSTDLRHDVPSLQSARPDAARWRRCYKKGTRTMLPRLHVWNLIWRFNTRSGFRGFPHIPIRNSMKNQSM